MNNQQWHTQQQWPGGPPPQQWQQPPQPPKKNKGAIVAIIVAIVVIVVLVIAGGIWLITREETPPIEMADMDEQWSVTVAYQDNDNPDQRTYALYNAAHNRLVAFAPNGGSAWVATAFNADGSPAGTIDDIPECDGDRARPFELNADGDIICVNSKPADLDRPQFIGDDMQPIVNTGDVIVAVEPNNDAAKAVTAFDRDGINLWRVDLDDPGRVGSDGTRMWSVTDTPADNESTIRFFSDGTDEANDDDATDATDTDATDTAPPKQAAKPDFMKSFDFSNTAYPFSMEHPCEGMSYDGWVMDTEVTSDCWTPVRDGRSKEIYEGEPLITTDNADITWGDYNGDGYTDALVTVTHFGTPGQFLFIANPDDPDHPYAAYFGIDSGDPYVFNDGKFEIRLDDTVVAAIGLYEDNGKPAVKIIK